jgi:hypothetical protein
VSDAKDYAALAKCVSCASSVASVACAAAEADVADDPAGIDDRGDPAALVDVGEDREADCLFRAVPVIGVVPVFGRRGEDDRAVGGEGLFEPGELEHVGVADAEGKDDPRSAELGELGVRRFSPRTKASAARAGAAVPIDVNM